MDEYIKRQQVIDELNKEGYTKNMRVHRHILDIPYEDVKPVIHAQWRSDAIVLDDNTTYCLIGCSACGRSNDEETPYCPHCGARMEGVSE